MLNGLIDLVPSILHLPRVLRLHCLPIDVHGHNDKQCVKALRFNHLRFRRKIEGLEDLTPMVQREPLILTVGLECALLLDVLHIASPDVPALAKGDQLLLALVIQLADLFQQGFLGGLPLCLFKTISLPSTC